MGMTEILFEAVAETNGAQFAGLVGTDGVRVEMVTLNDDLPIPLEDIEVEMALLANNASQTAVRLGSGLVRDLMIESDELVYFAAQVIPGYYAVMGMISDGNLNRARFAMDRMVYRLRTEL